MAFSLSSISELFTQETLRVVVEKALALKGTPDLKIKSYSVEAGAGKGDGYIGIIYRIKVVLSDGSLLPMIGKGLPPNMVRRKTFRCESYFSKEVLFYNQLAPMLRNFELERRGAEKVTSDSFLPIPECFHAFSDGQNDFLVIQDLTELGYGMTDRKAGLTLGQTNAILHSLARYHALSYGLQALYPEEFLQVAKGIAEPWFAPQYSTIYARYMFKIYNVWLRAVQDELEGTDVLEKLKAFGKNEHVLFEKICNSVQALTPSVINHGDAWSTNFLFSGDKPMMIDFQMARYCSPMADLSTFIFACTTEEQRNSAGGMDEILDNYYEVLCDSVNKLGVAKCPLTREQLQEHWRVNGLNGFAAALELVPFSMVESEDVQDIDRMEGEEPVDLVELTQFKDITDPAGKKRLVDLTRLAAHYDIRNMALSLKTISQSFTEEILQVAVDKALSLKGRTGLGIKSHYVEPGAEKGDGYMGIIYRIRVQLSDESELTLIAKGLPPNMVRRKTFRCESFFAKEVLFFNKLAPMLREFEIKRRGAEKVASDPLMPISGCYFAMSDGLNDFLVFEDLKALGYNMTDRISGPTEAQRTSLLNTLARFHALSYALQTLEPEKFSNAANLIGEPWFAPEFAKTYEGYMYKMYKLWHNTVKDELEGTEYLRKLEAFGKNAQVLFANLCKSVKLLNPSVINHGDTWSTNFLFDKSDKVMMIDFQLVRYCSPMSDLSIFIFSCTTEEQREAAGGMDALLRNYYNILCNAVHELGVSKCPLTWEQLQDQWRVNGLLGFSCALELVPLSLVESEDVQDLDRMEGNEPVDLVTLTQFKDITDPQGKKRLSDLTKLAVDYGMF
ncbi:uncharacterized protein LOC132203299 [Neocloeon triangulifer]|uniref:uncharacterized protein LOC132203299 n=1 Tax=Neocloeon triangulifer TaxID=2078957 RepID=UPI00286F6A2E|nr:uncharacterized protein LOC132203299 [Neocloeon triangulifer]